MRGCAARLGCSMKPQEGSVSQDLVLKDPHPPRGGLGRRMAVGSGSLVGSHTTSLPGGHGQPPLQETRKRSLWEGQGYFPKLNGQQGNLSTRHCLEAFLSAVHGVPDREGRIDTHLSPP